jgi:hypothetical protein
VATAADRANLSGWALFALLPGALAACADDDWRGEPRAGENAPYSSDAIGRIRLLEIPGQDEQVPSASAFFFDGVEQPPAELVVAVGPCALYRHRFEPCGESCDGSCAIEHLCVPQQRYLGAGDIAVTGLVDDLDLHFDPPGYYLPEPWPSGDLFRPGAAIRVTAEGGDIPAFAIEARGVADLEDEFPTMVLENDRDYTVRWTASGDEEAGFRLVLLTGWHGAPFQTMLLCEGPDTGSLDIPAEIIGRLPRFGLDPDFLQHSSEAARFTRQVAETDLGVVELVVAHSVGVYWQHDAPR